MLAAARRRQPADTTRLHAEPLRIGFEPAHTGIHILDRGRVDGRIGKPEVEREDADAVFCEIGVNIDIVKSVAAAPRASVDFNHIGNRAGTSGPIEGAR